MRRRRARAAASTGILEILFSSDVYVSRSLDDDDKPATSKSTSAPEARKNTLSYSSPVCIHVIIIVFKCFFFQIIFRCSFYNNRRFLL